ncbi:uroporphyrinogen-III synthase [Sulfobacillus thermosulfidooxidans]|uniref:uroporphyrinogen-III synthase n=1 Tax=Sulfobacillus thermosulfidooxidans TaxID=28034 RepID=UPI0006B4FBC3|nr:uroporphyrinogen-III synthase [Sulfobacillus thermosulfidooxidans]
MASRIYFIGTGPSTRVEWLTKEAWDILERVQHALIVDDSWPPYLLWPWAVEKEYVAASEVLARMKFWSAQDDQVAVLVAQSPAHHVEMSSWVKWAQEQQVMGTIVPGLWDMTVMLDMNGFCVASPFEAEYRAAVPLRLRGGQGENPFVPRETWRLWPTGQWTHGDIREESSAVLKIATDSPQPHFWLSHQPLYGRTLLLLHGGATARKASTRLQELGAHVYIAPISQIEDPPSWTIVDQTLIHIERYDWVIFTSQEAVSRFFQSFKRLNMDIRRLRAHIAVVGPQTEALVKDYGLYPVLMPENEYSQEGLARAFSRYSLLGVNILLPQGNLNRTYLQDFLAQQGALVSPLQCYQNVAVPLSPSIVELLEEHKIDAIFYTASSSVDHVVTQHPHLQDILRQIPAISIGRLTSRRLMHYGIPVTREPIRSSVDAMIDEVVHYFMKE